MVKTKIIPIFPLDLVLFPNQELPLRIFEPRYKQMIDDCMLSNKEFGVCLIDSKKTVLNWQAPHTIGTIAKIIDCNDIDSTSGHLMLNTKGHQKFRIIRMINPSLNKPDNYDPHSHYGREEIDRLNHESVTPGKMYLQAEVELLDDIDDIITINDWHILIKSWKMQIASAVAPQIVSSEQLDSMLEQYYLKTDMPTLEYVYSLCALGASSPHELQPVLEARTIEQLIDRCLKLFSHDDNMMDFQPQDS
jgi:hypothetical protein